MWLQSMLEVWSWKALKTTVHLERILVSNDQEGDVETLNNLSQNAVK